MTPKPTTAAASTERESLVYDGEQVCAACPVASGECPRCHTFWVMRADGKRFGFRANARIVSLLAGTGDDSGLDSTAAATLQAYVDQKWADVTDRGTQPTPPVPPSDAASSVRQEVADRDELGSLVVWLRTGQQTMPEGCSGPWLAALERILDHIDAFGGMRYVQR